MFGRFIPQDLFQELLFGLSTYFTGHANRMQAITSDGKTTTKNVYLCKACVFSYINKHETIAKQNLENEQIYCLLFSSNKFSYYSEREIIRAMHYSQLWGN